MKVYKIQNAMCLQCLLYYVSLWCNRNLQNTMGLPAIYYVSLQPYGNLQNAMGLPAMYYVSL